MTETPSAAPTPKRVLITEDDWLIGIELESALTEAGYEVIGIAATLAEATRLCLAVRPDFVLMDVTLGKGGDGIEAAAELRARFGVRSVFLTAHSDPETLARAKRTDPLGMVAKPIAGAELVRRLSAITATLD